MFLLNLNELILEKKFFKENYFIFNRKMSKHLIKQGFIPISKEGNNYFFVKTNDLIYFLEEKAGDSNI